MKTFLPEIVTYAEHAADILERAAALIERERRFALITSLAIKGGAAREVGSLALVEEDGKMTGYLSNGCIDRDIQHHALAALQSGSRQVIRYGDGSRFADLKLPCGGALDVLIDPAPDNAALLAARSTIAARRPVILSFRNDAGGAPDALEFTYLPRFRLCLAGRGAIFRSLAQVGHATGFEICLISPDTEDLAAIGHLASRPPVHLTARDQVTGMDLLDDNTAFLTLFHDHDWEPALLLAAMRTPAHFIGSLGSRRTHALRCEALRQAGASDEALARLHGPIGLVPSLRDASFIAVSALAEIVAAFPAAIRQTGTVDMD